MYIFLFVWQKSHSHTKNHSEDYKTRNKINPNRHIWDLGAVVLCKCTVNANHSYGAYENPFLSICSI